jgi:hypothetical protein
MSTTEAPELVLNLIKELEKRAIEIETPLPGLLSDGAKDSQWHCSSRAAGIRDAIRSIKLAFSLGV